MGAKIHRWEARHGNHGLGRSNNVNTIFATSHVSAYYAHMKISQLLVVLLMLLPSGCHSLDDDFDDVERETFEASGCGVNPSVQVGVGGQVLLNPWENLLMCPGSYMNIHLINVFDADSVRWGILNRNLEFTSYPEGLHAGVHAIGYGTSAVWVEYTDPCGQVSPKRYVWTYSTPEECNSPPVCIPGSFCSMHIDCCALELCDFGISQCVETEL